VNPIESIITIKGKESNYYSDYKGSSNIVTKIGIITIPLKVPIKVV
jgi:hypothetical protein